MNPFKHIEVEIGNIEGASEMVRMSTRALGELLNLKTLGTLAGTKEFETVYKIAEVYALNAISTSLLLILRSNEFHQRENPFEKSGLFPGGN